MKSANFTLLLCLFVSNLFAQQKTISVTAKDGETGTFELITDDPDLAPQLYIGPIGFVNLGFGRTRMQYGLGADAQYTIANRAWVHFNYMRKLGLGNDDSSEPEELQSFMFTGIDANIGYYFSSDIEETEVMIKMKAETKGRTTELHVFNMPAKVRRMLGVKAGITTYDLPVNYYVNDGTNINQHLELTLVSTRATIFSAGLKKTSAYMLELDSKEFGPRNNRARTSFYADVLFAPSPEAIFYHRPVDNGQAATTMSELEGYEHSYKVIKAGMRIGYERYELFWKRSGIATHWRAEAGYRPGIKKFGGGFFLMAQYGLSFSAL